MELLKSSTIVCPYCGESMAVEIDCSVDYQEYIEDCQVCCRPITMAVSVDSDYEAHIGVRHEDES